MRAVERAAGRGVARAVFASARRDSVLDLGRRLVEQRLLHPAVERDLGGGKRRGRSAAARRARPAGARTVSARSAATATASSAVSCSTASSQCGSGRGSSSRRLRERSDRSSAETRPECSASTASTSRSRKRRRSEAGPVEQPVHRRRQPDHPQMVGESGRRRDRLAVDAALAAWSARLRRRGASMPVPSVARPSAPSTSPTPPRSRRLRRRRPRRAWRGASRGPGARKEIASIRLVLPAPFGPTSTTSVAPTSMLRRAIAAEIRQRAGGGCGRRSCAQHVSIRSSPRQAEPVSVRIALSRMRGDDARADHTRIGIST